MVLQNLFGCPAAQLRFGDATDESLFDHGIEGLVNLGCKALVRQHISSAMTSPLAIAQGFLGCGG